MKKTKSKVFILGAGCSANCGYPLGSRLVTEFEKFLIEDLSEDPTEYPTIKQTVTDTIDLLKQFPGTETLDQLAERIEQELSDRMRRRVGSSFGEADRKREELAAKQTLDAKIAMCALILARENKARQTRLPSYRSFVTQIFGGPPWTAAREADCHVLTFNYDRLFEIAFSESFPEFDLRSHSPYGRNALNSGFDLHYGEWSAVQPESGRFCFLKLHGSAGWWVKVKENDGHGARSYCPAVPVEGMSLKKIEQSIPKLRGRTYGSEPLLAFPRERQDSQEFFDQRGESRGDAWAPYIDTLWQHAATVIADATEVRVIGYSFNPIDSRQMVTKLLTKATCEKIIIQNTVDVRKSLESYKELRVPLDFDPTPF